MAPFSDLVGLVYNLHVITNEGQPAVACGLLKVDESACRFNSPPEVTLQDSRELRDASGRIPGGKLKAVSMTQSGSGGQTMVATVSEEGYLCNTSYGASSG